MQVLITGASRGIGSAIAEKFINNGHSVYNPSRQELDLSKSCKLKHTNFDIIINNAGINNLKSIIDINNIDVLTVNYLSPLNIIQQCLPYMIKNNFGRIVNIGSILIDFSKQSRSAYSASKSALHSLTKSIVSEFAQYNILANTVSPGFIDTELTRKNNNDNDLFKIIQTVPVKRLGDPKEIADIVYFLCINNSFIAGQNIIVDGGFSSCIV